MMDSMAVSKGYKTSDIGLIPNQWSIYLLDEIVSVFRGGSPRPIQDFLTTSTKGINWIKIGDASVGAKYIDSTKEKIIPEGITRSRYVEAGDVLLSNSMSFGRPYILRTNGCIHDGWLVLKNFGDKIDKDYLYYMLSSNVILKQYKSKAAGSGVLNLNKKLVSSVNLLLPPLREQKAIAEVLTDTDTLIQSLEKLIVKKKKIKQGAMQQLLTGEKRLPGYSAKWDKYKLKEIAHVGRGRVISHTEINRSIEKTYPVYSSQTSNEGIMGYIDTYDFEGDYLTWTTDGVNAGKVFYRSGRFNCTNVCGTIKLKKFDYKYVAMALDHVTDKYVSKNLANPKLMNDVMKKIIILLPSIEEQKAIAQILSDMDAEIKALEEKLEKYKKIKQGMMQELLTGRIRLI